jgi:hypothetical protein
MMRQIVGSFAQYEKTRLVTKLRGARERIRETERDPAFLISAESGIRIFSAIGAPGS